MTISGIIGQDTTLQYVRSTLSAARGRPIEIVISSPGGAVFEGYAISSEIRRYTGQTTARVIGLAASMASYIAANCDIVVVEETSAYMIHNPSQVVAGGAAEHQRSAETLEKLAEQMSAAYARKAGKSTAEIRGLMAAETWYYGREIVEAGFADVFDSRDSGSTDIDRAGASDLAHAAFSIDDNTPAYARVAASFVDVSNATAEDRQAAAIVGMTLAEFMMYSDRPTLSDSEIDEQAAKFAGMSVADLRRYTEAQR